jgi:hypothetical protein
MPATPDRHFSIAMSVAPVSAIDHLVNGGRIEAPVIALRQESQIRRLGFELGAERAGAFAIVAVTTGAIIQVLRPALVGLLRPRRDEHRHHNGRGRQTGRDRLADHVQP